jgi:hypothetical protein
MTDKKGEKDFGIGPEHPIVPEPKPEHPIVLPRPPVVPVRPEHPIVPEPEPKVDLDKLEGEVLNEIQDILKEHGYLESNIGINNKYWNLKNQHRQLVDNIKNKV